MTLGQLLFELPATQKENGRTDNGKSKCLPIVGAQKSIVNTSDIDLVTPSTGPSKVVLPNMKSISLLTKAV
jgi:hypothetical protein